MIVKLKQVQEALAAINDRSAHVCVIGLGYVGLPLVQRFVESGYRVTGFDVDENKVRLLKKGKSYIHHIGADVIKSMLATKRFRATTNPHKLREVDCIIICVPTPLTANREPDMSHVTNTCKTIRDNLTPGQLIVLESTTYPGTLRNVVKPILEESKLKAGKHFFLAYSPEREDPGNANFKTQSIPKVVGGLDAEGHQLACALYQGIVEKIVPVSSPEVAEACKILENTYRAVNIALVNELKVLFERMGINIWEVIDAAKTKPFGFQAFYPGPGLGGHCIPIDPFYLTWLARQFECSTRFIELAGEINTAMPEYVIHRLSLALNAQGKAIRGSKICVLGIAYKKNVDDTRESPSLAILSRLQELNGVVSYHDLYVPRIPATRKYRFGMSSTPLTKSFLRSLDAVLIVTDHDNVDYEFVARHAPLIVDTRNAVSNVPGNKRTVWAA